MTTFLWIVVQDNDLKEVTGPMPEVAVVERATKENIALTAVEIRRKARAGIQIQQIAEGKFLFALWHEI